VDEFAEVDVVDGFRRQLPVGIFDGAISSASRWSPGGKCQIDLWALAVDKRTVHLFELKIDDNVKLGILPKALWYARFVHRIRIGDFGGKAVIGGGEAFDAIRNADRRDVAACLQTASAARASRKVTPRVVPRGPRRDGARSWHSAVRDRRGPRAAPG
jgi:hypothetical protein